MPTNVVVPSLGESIKQAVLLRWHKADGERIAIDEPLCELETDKANVDVPSPVAGLVRHTHKEGDTVTVGEVIGRVDEAAAASSAQSAPKKTGAQATASPPAAAKSAPKTAAPTALSDVSFGDYSPSVRTLLEEQRLDARAVGSIPRTGPNDRLTKEDVEKYLASRTATGNGGKIAPSVISQESAAARDDVARPPKKPTPLPAAAPAKAPPMDFDANGIHRAPMSNIRKRIAERLVAAQQTAAILTTINEVDMQAINELRAKFKERFAEIHGVGLGFMSFFARACVMALREFPRVNAFIEGDEVVYHNYLHLGIAVSTDRGLAVPVLRHVEAMSFARIEAEIKRLANATRDGKLGIEELSGGTFTITNGGIFGSLLSTPILNPPQSGILGMHAIQQRPVAINGKVEIRPMMYIALSYDHRLVDGRESVSFLVRLKQLLEDPARLMLEI